MHAVSTEQAIISAADIQTYCAKATYLFVKCAICQLPADRCVQMSYSNAKNKDIKKHSRRLPTLRHCELCHVRMDKGLAWSMNVQGRTGLRERVQPTGHINPHIAMPNSISMAGSDTAVIISWDFY